MTITTIDKGVYLGDVDDDDFETLGEIVLEQENGDARLPEERWGLNGSAVFSGSAAYLVEERWGLYSNASLPDIQLDQDEETMDVE